VKDRVTVADLAACHMQRGDHEAIVGGERKPVIDKGEKHYPKAIFWASDNLITENFHLSGLRE
jgi:hypothetical protein